MSDKFRRSYYHTTVTLGPLATTGPTWIKVHGTVDLGLIDEAAAAALKCKAGPIRLPKGVGGPKGHGLKHIQENPSRMKEIQNLGYETAERFIAEIASQWTTIVRDEKPNRLGLVHSIPGYGLKLIVQLYNLGPNVCWSVTTAIPGRKIRASEIL